MDTYIGQHGNAFFILIAMLIVVIAQIAWIWVKNQNEYSDRILVFTILAFLGVFAGLVVTQKESATGVFSLLGVIAGYLVGRTRNP